MIQTDPQTDITTRLNRPRADLVKLYVYLLLVEMSSFLPSVGAIVSKWWSPLRSHPATMSPGFPLMAPKCHPSVTPVSPQCHPSVILVSL